MWNPFTALSNKLNTINQQGGGRGILVNPIVNFVSNRLYDNYLKKPDVNYVNPYKTIVSSSKSNAQGYVGPIKVPDYSKSVVSPTWSNEGIRAGLSASQQYGIPARVLLSQMALESSRGTSEAARSRNNYFGYQAYDKNPSGSRGFVSPINSAQAYGRLISQDPRYAQAYALRNNPTAMVNALGKVYATDPNYAKKVMSTPEWRTY